MKHQCAMIALFFTLSIAEAASKDDDSSKYYAACREIDKTDAERVRDITQQMRREYDHDYMRSINRDLDFCRLQAEQKREKALQEFKNYYEISDDHWKGIRYRLFDMHTAKAKNRSRFCPGIVGDRNVPTSATFLIQKELLSRGINTSQVDLSSKEGDSLLCEVMIGKKRDRIAIDPNVWNQWSLEQKQWKSLCIVGALEEELSLLPLLLKQCWHNITPAKQKDFAGVERIINMTNIVNMYFLCLRGKGASFLVKKYAYNLANPCFTLDDYQFISSVDWRWQVRSVVPHYVYPCWWLGQQPSLEGSEDFSNTTSTSEESEGESGSGGRESSDSHGYDDLIG